MVVGEGDSDYYRKVEGVQDKMKEDLEQRMVMREYLFPCWEGTQTDHHALKRDRLVKVRQGRQALEVNQGGQVLEGVLCFYTLM